MPESAQQPFPRYLLRSEARAVIAAIEEMGYTVELRVPAIGAVSITITGPDGQSRTETGRAELLDEAIITVASHAGIEFQEE